MSVLIDSVRRSHPWSLIAAAGAALVVTAAIGWGLGGAARPAPPAVAANVVAAVGDLRIELENGWAPADAAPAVAGAQAYAPVPGVDARALLVHGPAVDASLLPAALRDVLPAALPEPRRARLAGLRAWSYGPLRAEGRILQVTVVPTTGGTFAVACSAQPAGWDAAAGCTGGVYAISSQGARTLVPAPALAFRQQAGPALGALDGRRVALRARLADTRRPAAATALADVHRSTAATLAPFAAPGASEQVVAALRDAARGYDALASATRRDARRPFIRARAAVARADVALAAALRELRH